MTSTRNFGTLLLVCSVIVMLSCSSKTVSSSATPGKYSEDLAPLRATATRPDTSKTKVPLEGKITRDPAVYVEPRHAINKPLDAVLDSISEYNLRNGVVDGFTIQVYSGIKREEALNIRKQLSITLPDLEADVQYVQPNFRVRTGKYFNRLEAQKDFLSVKRHFPNAIVIPDRIFFNK